MLAEAEGLYIKASQDSATFQEVFTIWTKQFNFARDGWVREQELKCLEMENSTFITQRILRGHRIKGKLCHRILTNVNNNFKCSRIFKLYEHG